MKSDMGDTSDVKGLKGPFYSLEPGCYIQFSLFPDVPPDSIVLREGVILAVDVQVASISKEESTVQTLLALVTRSEYEGGKKEPTEIVPLEALKYLSVEPPAEKVLEVWSDAVPALKGVPKPAPGAKPLDIEAIKKSQQMAGLRPPKQKKKVSKKKDVKKEEPALYISRKGR